MLSILSGLLGIFSSGLPNLLSFFQNKGDQAHERQMAQLQMQQQLAMAEKGFQSQEKIEELRLQEVEAETYAQERTALYDLVYLLFLVFDLQKGYYFPLTFFILLFLIALVV